MPGNDNKTIPNTAGTVAASAAADHILFPAVKKSDSILDIPKIPFDADRHQSDLKQGECEIRERHYIALIRANKRGKGFGKAVYREEAKKAIQESQNTGCPKQLTAQVDE